ncbi:hypothetical protein Tco_0899399 [Tanacetum coccineum]
MVRIKDYDTFQDKHGIGSFIYDAVWLGMFLDLLCTAISKDVNAASWIKAVTTAIVWWHGMEQDVEVFIMLKKFQQVQRKSELNGKLVSFMEDQDLKMKITED